MKRQSKLIIALGVLAAFICGYFVVSHFTQEEDASGAEAQEIIIAQMEPEQIEKLDFTYQEQEISLYKTEDGQWQVANAQEFPLDSDKVNAMTAAFEAVTAARKVSEDASHQSDFGLNTPQCTIRASTADSTVTLCLGDYNQNTDSYYVCLADSAVSYLTDSTLADLFCVSLNSLIALDSWESPSTANITRVEINGLTLQNYPEGNPDYYLDSQTWFIQTDGEKAIAADAEAVSTLLSSLASLSYSGCAAYNFTEADKVAYGLDTPSYTVSVNYTEQTEDSESETEKVLVFYIGNACEDGGYYVLRQGASMICTMTSTTLSSVLSASTAELRDDTVFAMSLETVSSAQLITQAGSVTIDADDGNEHESFQTFFSALTELTAEGQAASQENSGTAPALTAIFIRNTENFAEMTFGLYEYDTNFYRVIFNGRSDLLIGKRAAEKLISLAEPAN